MAAPKEPSGAEKRKRSKKKKSRTEISSSDSNSDSDVETKKTRTSKSVAKDDTSMKHTTLPKNTKKLKSRTKEDADTSLVSPETSPAPTGSKLKSAPSATNPQPQRQEEDFSSIYLRKITTELADDLDKVRAAQDFKNSSLPILIQALKQGESCFSAEEKRRVVSAAPNV